MAMTALDDILALDDAGTADEIDARHDRGQHRVRLVGAEAHAPALQEAAPWLSWSTSAGTPSLPWRWPWPQLHGQPSADFLQAIAEARTQRGRFVANDPAERWTGRWVPPGWCLVVSGELERPHRRTA